MFMGICYLKHELLKGSVNADVVSLYRYICWILRHPFELPRWSSLLYQPQYYPTMGAQYNETFSALSSWTLTRLAWMDGALQQAAANQAQAQAPFAVLYPPVAAQASVNTAG